MSDIALRVREAGAIHYDGIDSRTLQELTAMWADMDFRGFPEMDADIRHETLTQHQVGTAFRRLATIRRVR